MDTQQATEIFYDGACPVCRREIAAYKGLRGLENARWTDVSTPGAAPDGISKEEALARFHIRRADGTLASGPAAFLAIWRANPRFAPLARALDRQPFLALGEAAYRAFLRIRKLWRRP